MACRTDQDRARPWVHHAAGRSGRRGASDRDRRRGHANPGPGDAGGERRGAAARGRRGLRPGRKRRRPDPGRASPAAAARDALLVPRDRGAALCLAQHDQDAGDLGLPQARRLEPQRRDRGGAPARPLRAPARPRLRQGVAQFILGG